jgi:hypothetical protein
VDLFKPAFPNHLLDLAQGTSSSAKKQISSLSAQLLWYEAVDERGNWIKRLA